MKRIPVDECPAGPALDAAVAKVLGYVILACDALESEDLGYPRIAIVRAYLKIHGMTEVEVPE